MDAQFSLQLKGNICPESFDAVTRLSAKGFLIQKQILISEISDGMWAINLELGNKVDI